MNETQAVETLTPKKVNFVGAFSGDYVTNESYKVLRANIFFSGMDFKVIAITSCNENEGKSTISTKLSSSIAEYGLKTLLIDGDMRKSVMLKGESGSSVKGLSDVLAGIENVEDCIYKTQNENFDVLFSGRFPPNPVELIGNNNFKKLVEKLRPKYDYIIIDTPPLGLVIDAAVIASSCDGAIIAISSGNNSKKTVIDVKEQLTKSGCKIIGAVLNNTKKNKNSSYKKYKSAYYYKKKDKKQ